MGLGTFIAVETDTAGPEVAAAGIQAAFDAVQQVDRLMHPSRADSDLARIRNGPPGVPLTVHAWTWELLALCLRLNRLSRGLFDPCLPESPARLDGLELLAAPRLVAHGCLHLDLGGIAKGFAVDRAIDALRTAGCDGGLVNAGGDLAVFGERAHEIVALSSRGPVSIPLSNAALAASDRHACSRPSEHRGYYHGARGAGSPCVTPVVTSWVSPPGTDEISRPVRNAVVIAPSAALADGLTTCLMIGRLDPSTLDHLSAQWI